MGHKHLPLDNVLEAITQTAPGKSLFRKVEYNPVQAKVDTEQNHGRIILWTEAK